MRAQVDALWDLGVPTEVFELRGQRRAGNYARAIGPLRRAVRAFAADIVYAFYGLTGWVALWQPAPVVLSLAGDDILGTPRRGGGISNRSRIGIALSQWAAQRAAVVCVQSEAMQSRLWSSRVRQQALVVPYGVDPRRFHPGNRNDARRRLGIPVEERLVIFPNTPTEPRKRLDVAQEAVAQVRRSLPEATLRVLSGIPHDQMPDYYRAADCCLLTSEWEGSPNVVKEALLSGLPVVSTDVGDVGRWLPLSPECAICDRTPAAIAAAVLRVLRQHGRVDPTPFLAGFSSPAIARRMLHIFEAVSAGRTGAAGPLVC